MKRLVGENMLLQKKEGVALFCRLDRSQRVARIGISSMIAIERFAGHEVRRQMGTIAILP